jgi:hypothetical protein
MTLRRHFSAVILVVLAISVVTAVLLTTLAPTSGAAGNPKIAARVLAETAHGNATEAVIVLSVQADLRFAASLSTKAANGRFVVNALREVASRTQAPIVAQLEKRGIPYQSFWVVNMIQVSGNRALLNELASRSDVKQIEANPHVRTNLPTLTALETFDVDQPARIEWNVTKVKAPKVWALGFKGEGHVVAGADTGVQWDHPALKGHYRGWNGTKANHDFNWHDATSAHTRRLQSTRTATAPSRSARWLETTAMATRSVSLRARNGLHAATWTRAERARPRHTPSVFSF